MYNKIPIHYKNLALRIKTIQKWNIPKQDKKDIVKFLKDMSIGKVNRGKKISEMRQIKVINLLKIPLNFFNKSIKKLSQKNIEKFEYALTSDKIKNFQNKPLSELTKIDIKVMLRAFLKWKLGEAKALKLVGWLDTRAPKRTPNYLSEEEITKLYKSCKNNEERFLIAILFDTGARAEEIHNIRFEDIQMPKNSENFVKLTLKAEYSKTNGRTISLYWKNSLEAVREYLEERKQEGIKSDEPVLKTDYNTMRQTLKRLGQRALKKSIHYHLFRHSSATFYAPKLNRQEICYRFGWAFASKMPDIYISRAGLENSQLDEKFESTELGELKNKLNKEEFERKKLQEEIEKLKKVVLFEREGAIIQPEIFKAKMISK